MNALLVYPLFPVTYWGFQYSMPLIDKRATLPPLGLLSVAALLPEDWRLRLVDLNLAELQDHDLRWADVVLTGGLLIQTESMREVIAGARALGIPVAVGGPAPSTSPQLFDQADVVFRGEAEGRVDTLISALARGSGGHQLLDAPERFPDLEAVPTPRFDLLDLPAYASVSVQYSRGCPFQCEFCDVIEIFGRSARVKTAAQLVGELEAVYRLGYRGTVFIVDDNFIGNRAAVRRLLPEVESWQRSRGYPFALYTEATVDLAADPKLLRAMVDAGFKSVFLGIETPSVDALKETRKLQNLCLDPSEAVDRITRAGIEVMGGFIVGFDSDEPNIFAAQRDFLGRQPLPLAMAGLLTALPGTALWRRLEAEGRLRQRSNGETFVRPNFVPRMDEEELLSGYAELMRWLYSPEEYYKRCEAFLDRVGTGPSVGGLTFSDVMAAVRTVWHVGVRSPRRRRFWRLMAKVALRGRSRMRQSVVHVVQGEHLIRYTLEHVLPRIERSLAEVREERANASAVVPTAPRSEPSGRLRAFGVGDALPAYARPLSPARVRDEAPRATAMGRG